MQQHYLFVVVLCALTVIKLDANNIEIPLLINENAEKTENDSINVANDIASNECSKGKPEHLILTYNPKSHIQLLFNVTTHTVPVLDFRNNMSAMYNGRTGAVFLFNYATGEGVFIPAGTTDITWYSSRTSFSDYFTNLPPQKNLYLYGQTHGIRFDPTTVTEELSDEMLKVLEPLSSEYSEKCDALAIILQISKVTSNYFYTSLRGYAEVMGSVDSEFRGDLKWLFGFYQGLGIFFEEFDGGMEILARKKIKLNLGQILTQQTGFHIIIYFLKELHGHFNIKKTLGKALNSPEKFIPIVDKFSGQLSYGYDGYIHVLTEIVDFATGRNSLRNVEIVLHQYCTNPKTNFTLVKEQWEKSLEDLLETIEELKLHESLAGLIELTTHLLDGKWTYNGVDVGKILGIVIEGDISKMEEVMKLMKFANEVP